MTPTISSICLLYRYKDTIEEKILSDILLRFTCSNCKVIYCGKTFCQSSTKAEQHIGISNLHRKRLNKSVKQLAVYDQLLEYNCLIGSDHFNILSSDASKFRLLIKKSLFLKYWARSS